MDYFRHPTSSSWLMDLPLQIEAAKKLASRLNLLQKIRQKWRGSGTTPLAKPTYEAASLKR